MPPVRAAGLRWDGEAEIVIVGSGGAGVSAALAARERTKGRIVILEKLGVTGGSTRFSCGYFNAVDPERQRAQGIEDSLERHIADTNASGRGRGDPELVSEIITATTSSDDFFTNKNKTIHKNDISIADMKIIIRLKSFFFGFFNESSLAITEPPAFCTIMHRFTVQFYHNKPTLKTAFVKYLCGVSIILIISIR